MSGLDELELAILVGHLASPVLLLASIAFRLQGPGVKGDGQDHGEQAGAEGLAGGLEVLVVSDTHRLEAG